MADIELGTEQAMPVPNDAPSVQGMVRADLETREQLGVQRYGTALRDAYEEALDLACYLRQAIAERPREDVDAAVAEVQGRLDADRQRWTALEAELRRVMAAMERARDLALAERNSATVENHDLGARLQDARGTVDELTGLLNEILSHFAEPIAGETSVRTYWIPRATVDGWRNTVYGPPLAAAIAAEQEGSLARG